MRLLRLTQIPPYSFLFSLPKVRGTLRALLRHYYAAQLPNTVSLSLSFSCLRDVPRTVCFRHNVFVLPRPQPHVTSSTKPAYSTGAVGTGWTLVYKCFQQHFLSNKYIAICHSPVSKIAFPGRFFGKNDGTSSVLHRVDDAIPGSETSARICAPLLPPPTTATRAPLKSSAFRY